MNKYQLNTNFNIENILHLTIFRKKLYPKSVAQLLTYIYILLQFLIHFYKITFFYQTTPKLAENNAKLLETRTRVSDNLEKFPFLLLDVTLITSRTGIISWPECVDIYTKVKLVHRTLDVYHSCTFLLSFTVANNFLHFVNNLTGTIPENPLNHEWKNRL